MGGKKKVVSVPVKGVCTSEWDLFEEQTSAPRTFTPQLTGLGGLKGGLFPPFNSPARVISPRSPLLCKTAALGKRLPQRAAGDRRHAPAVRGDGFMGDNEAAGSLKGAVSANAGASHLFLAVEHLVAAC